MPDTAHVALGEVQQRQPHVYGFRITSSLGALLRHPTEQLVLVSCIDHPGPAFLLRFVSSCCCQGNACINKTCPKHVRWVSATCSSVRRTPLLLTSSVEEPLCEGMFHWCSGLQRCKESFNMHVLRFCPRGPMCGARLAGSCTSPWPLGWSTSSGPADSNSQDAG